ncbi:MAG TPA: hypothetical protein VHE30_21255 [Polyangiaceae bacterium]|nr:hypothetical protein [Polyangiaceae bacterium]
MGSRAVASLLLVAVSVVVAASCGGTVRVAAARTSPVAICGAANECGGGLDCVCGVCSRQCTDDAGCPEGHACATDGSATFLSLCGGEVTRPAGVCVPRCTELDGGASTCSGRDTCGDVGCQPTACNTDYAAIARSGGATVSFRRDVMPFFGMSCVASSCHNQTDRVAGLDLGVRCKYDPPTKGCVFPDAVDPTSTSSNPPAPLTDDVVARVREGLLAPSSTAPAVLRVEPGHPERSFLVDSLLGTTNERGYVCSNQDTTHEPDPKPCGEFMPLTIPPLCMSSLGRRQVDTVIRWILEGAQDD